MAAAGLRAELLEWRLAGVQERCRTNGDGMEILLVSATACRSWYAGRWAAPRHRAFPAYGRLLGGDMRTGQDVYVIPLAVPGNLSGGDGSQRHPFHSVGAAMAKAKASGGGVVRPHGGHYVESVSLENFRQDGQKIVVRPDGGGEVYRLDAS
jgi:hypothetical protein